MTAVIAVLVALVILVLLGLSADDRDPVDTSVLPPRRRRTAFTGEGRSTPYGRPSGR